MSNENPPRVKTKERKLLRLGVLVPLITIVALNLVFVNSWKRRGWPVAWIDLNPMGHDGPFVSVIALVALLIFSGMFLFGAIAGCLHLTRRVQLRPPWGDLFDIVAMVMLILVLMSSFATSKLNTVPDLRLSRVGINYLMWMTVFPPTLVGYLLGAWRLFSLLKTFPRRITMLLRLQLILLPLLGAALGYALTPSTPDTFFHLYLGVHESHVWTFCGSMSGALLALIVIGYAKLTKHTPADTDILVAEFAEVDDTD